MRTHYSVRVLPLCSNKYESLSHSHDACELIFVKRGTLKLVANDESMLLAQGNLVFLKSGEPHYVKTNTDSEMLILLFDHNQISWLPLARGLKTQVMHNDHDFEAMYNAIVKELDKKDLYYENAVKNELSSFMIRLYRGEESERAKSGSLVKISALAGLIADIDSFYVDYTSEKGAQFMQMSPSHFSRFFHQKTGILFSEYLNIVRVGKSVELISDIPGIKTKELASACGFRTERNFSRVFKTYTGATPKTLPENYIFDQCRILSAAADKENSSFIKTHFAQTYKPGIRPDMGVK